MTTPKSPWDLDIRVRERNLKKGVLDEKEVEKMLKELPDAIANSEAVTTPQPALSGSGAPQSVPPSSGGGSPPQAP
jgi:hypothetical protein